MVTEWPLIYLEVFSISNPTQDASSWVPNLLCPLFSKMPICSSHQRLDRGIAHPNLEIHLVQNVDDTTRRTQLTFGAEMSLWNAGCVCMTKTKLYISDIASLRKEGVYCYSMKAWKRCYVSREGVCISIVEDVPESGGQFCLWTAGLVLTNFLEYDYDFRRSLKDKRVLEIGAGAGLTSMMASILGANVVCTEPI